jgi:hypothetical protein
MHSYREIISLQMASSGEIRIDVSREMVRNQVIGLYEDAVTMSRSAKMKAGLLKMCSVLCAILVIILGMTVAMMSVFEFEEKQYFMVISGCLVSGIKAVIMIFNPEYRASVLKHVHIRSRKLARSVMEIIQTRSTVQDIKINLIELQKEFDELDLASFMATIALANSHETK